MELDFPTIEAPAAAPAPNTAVAMQASGELDMSTLDLEAVALSAFGQASAAVATANAKLTGVVHDLSTPTKLADAKSLRHRLINVPLAEARKTSAALKSKLTSVSKAVGVKLAAIESDFDAAEKLITPQIDAAQAKLDEEARIKREAEAARQQKHRDNLAKLAEPAERCKQPGMTAERIANGISAVAAIVIDRAAWEEFADRAEEQKAVTLERMQALHAAAVAAEAEAARLAAEKADQERKAAELQAEADRLAALAADLERQQAELKAAKDRADEAARLEREQQESIARAAQAERDEEARQQREAADLAAKITQDAQESGFVAETSAPCVSNEAEPAQASPSESGAAVQADQGTARSVVYTLAGAPPCHQTQVPTLSLGTIKERIAPLSITAEGLAALGFQSTKVKATCLYHEADWDDIKAAMRRVLA